MNEGDQIDGFDDSHLFDDELPELPVDRIEEESHFLEMKMATSYVTKNDIFCK
jgi:hypothetical protein